MSGYQNLSDNELIILLNDGDAIAFTEIYNRYHQLMLVFAHRKLKDEELAKDVVQELFANIWHKRTSLSESGNLGAYLYISLRSRIFDYFAHQKVEGKYLQSLKAFILEGTTGTDHPIREKQLSEYIEKQIQKLPAKMRRAFDMSRRQHLSYREIAEELGTTESNVSHHINNALKILKTRLNILFIMFWIC
ncbi:RNA polymerase sigma factor [Pedobacter sp. UBA4863]|uniref:RNA polymerase sigma factor n=1 Tax=Pedobacter sp. UBA4863 TaxID=1947060 RepID=UPI0025FE96FB|nr:RNA polymerase sigma-70 factor [Pedobacter sp. UBA4863]